MFDSDVSRDDGSKRVTRRTMIVGSVAVLAVAAVSLRRSRTVEASGETHGTPGEVMIVAFSNDGKKLSRQTVAKVVKTDAAWREQLGANSYGIARQADTEMPYSGVSWKEHSHGLYQCVCCDTALFSSETKFESGTGWPSFWAPIAEENLRKLTDRSLGIARTEVKCARCEGHLGHVFDDGPEPTGMRYCMNSASMRFVKG